MAAVTRVMCRASAPRLTPSPASRLLSRSSPRASGKVPPGASGAPAHSHGKFTLLERGLVLSSISYVAFEAYKWISEQVVVHASIKVDDIKEQADYLYGSGETEKLYSLLSQYKNSEDAELLWRLARASRDLSQLSKTAPDEKKKLIYEALDYAKKALEKNEFSFAAHKKAINLNPKDATSIHLMGLWCFTFAEMPWYQIKIASVLFATPPSSTFEEALQYFQKAEEADPYFYSKNLLYLGKTYLKLNNKKMALLWLSKAKAFPARSEEDKQVQKEAAEILKSMSDKK
ncbi:hypothetical protein FKM82_005985 [Ascaphus truei]